MADGTQLLRAVSNILWPYLRAGERGWKTYRETRVITPTGNPRASTYSSSPALPNPSTWIEVISISYKIITTLWSEDWPGGESWRITLDKGDADAAIGRLNAATIADYELALEHATCRKPFIVERKEDGERVLTRNRHDGTITNLTVAALEAIARNAELRLIPKHVEDALLTDTDINLDEILAARHRAGALEP